MPKRSRDGDSFEREPKRFRSLDRLSSLSDELLLKILSFLPVPALAISQRLSQRLKELANDSQLWKSLYYDRFVRPRASRIPRIREHATSDRLLHYSSKTSKWLEDEHLVRGRATNWKRQYKVRHNWSIGSCKVKETLVTERPSVPPLLIRLHDGIIITADATAGLRAWVAQGDEGLIAATPLGFKQSLTEASTRVPSSLAVDTARPSGLFLALAVGFVDGTFSIYELDRRKRIFNHLYSHPSSGLGPTSAIAYASPYLLTMVDSQLLSLYQFGRPPHNDSAWKAIAPPLLRASFKSQSAWSPISISIRAASAVIIVSIAYAVPTFLSGWSVGLQELHLEPEGEIVESRIASAASQSRGLHPPPRSLYDARAIEKYPGDARSLHPSTRPTSLSYTHPYLLISHADNTLTLFMVTSTAQLLEVSPGSRLWGHTSSVSGAHVSDRGKAVSASAHGDELRVWELEGGAPPSSSRRSSIWGGSSVEVRPSQLNEAGLGNEEGLELKGTRKAVNAPCYKRQDVGNIRNKGFLAFDEEKVVLLRQQLRGAETIAVYDFS